MDTAHNLLFAVLALHGDFLTREQFVAICALWANRKHASLADLLVEKGWLSLEDRAALQRLLDRKLQHHHGNTTEALATEADADVRDSLATVSGLDLWATLPPDALPAGPGHTTEQHAAGQPHHTRTRLHASGGIGRVWLARDEVFGRDVALKDLRPERANNPTIWARFLREARVTGQLQHPGIVPVYQIGTQPDTGQPFYTMRFVHGRTLGEAVRDYHRRRSEGSANALELRDLLNAFVAVCQAVAYAHSRGVLHRDLKPANIVLGEYGEVIVLDWGLARLLSEPAEAASEPAGSTVDAPVTDSSNPSATVQGHILGTPAYMAPEQARGEIDRLGPATDVYGLGAILYEVLAGKPPFTGPDVGSLLRQVQESPPVPPRTVVPAVPRPLEAVCLKALAREPARRYAGAAALANDVRRWLADEPVSAYPEPLLTRASRWARRHRPLVAGAVTALLLLVITGTALVVRHVQQREAVRRETALLGEEADQRHEAGLAAARAGDLDRAIAALSEAVGFCDRSESLTDRGQQIAGQLRQLERYRRFRARAAGPLRTGVHNVRDRDKADTVLRECVFALSVYEVNTRDDWLQAVEGSVLTAEQVGEVKRLAHDLLILLALRLAMFDTKDEAARVNTRRALELLDRATALEPATTGTWLLRMLWNRRLGNQEAANRAGERMARSVKQGGMKSARDYYLLGSVTLHLVKKPVDALEPYREAVKREPNHYGAHYGLYRCYQELNLPQSQLAPLSACLVLEPNDADLYYRRGLAYVALRQAALAFHDFDAVVMREPKHRRAWYHRGRMRIISKEYSHADNDFTQALKIDPAFTPALYWRAMARAGLGRYRQAVADAEKAAQREPGDAEALFRSAAAYAQAVQAVLADDREPARRELAQRYGDRAIELLKRARQLGVKDLGKHLRGPFFAPLQGRPDFKGLLDD